MIHLGKNPKKGGNPPKDNNEINKPSWTFKLRFKEVNWLTWVTLNLLKILITGVRIKK